MLNIFIYLLLAVLVIVSVLMVLIVLMQRPKNEGLGASFGGGMTQDLFGAQTTNVLQKFTVYLGGVFFILTLTLTVLYSKTSTSKPLIPLAAKGTPAARATPAAVATPTATPAAVATPVPVPVPAGTVPPEFPSAGQTATPATTP